MLLISLLSILLAAAQPTPGAAPVEAETEAPPALECSAHKFETTVEFTVGEKTKTSKVKLCGEAGQTDAQWLGTLEDAIEKVQADERLAAALKDQIVFALRAELARLAPERTADTAPAPAIPLEATPPAAVAAAAPPAAQKRSPAGKVALSLRCLTPGDIVGLRACDELQRDTLITVRADAALPGGATLRFLGDGRPRGEVALAPMRRGQTTRIRLPDALCARILRIDFTIEALRRGDPGEAVAQSFGPFMVRC